MSWFIAEKMTLYWHNGEQEKTRTQCNNQTKAEVSSTWRVYQGDGRNCWSRDFRFLNNNNLKKNTERFRYGCWIWAAAYSFSNSLPHSFLFCLDWDYDCCEPEKMLIFHALWYFFFFFSFGGDCRRLDGSSDECTLLLLLRSCNI